MKNMFLDKDEISELTGKKLRRTQKHALDTMGIIYKETPNGELKVLRDHVRYEFGMVDNPMIIEREYSPNWDMI
jgi:hypothetical protein